MFSQEKKERLNPSRGDRESPDPFFPRKEKRRKTPSLKGGGGGKEGVSNNHYAWRQLQSLKKGGKKEKLPFEKSVYSEE